MAHLRMVKWWWIINSTRRPYQTEKKSSVVIKHNEILFKNQVLTNENPTDYNNKVIPHCMKIKKESFVEKCYSRDEVVHIAAKDGWRNRALKVFHVN